MAAGPECEIGKQLPRRESVPFNGRFLAHFLCVWHDDGMERIAHKAKGHTQASEWDIQQQLAMTPQERIRAARELQRRAFGTQTKDVRACHKKK
jgi:hypothetical protein